MKSYARKTTIARNYKKKKPVSFSARVRKVITSAAQTKHMAGEISLFPVVGSQLYTFSPTQRIVTGSNVYDRLGDAVKLHKLKLNGYVIPPSVALANVKFRISVIYCALPVAAVVITNGGLSFSQVALAGTTTINPICLQYDEKAVDVLADITIDMNSLVSTSQDIKSWVMDIPLKDVRFNYSETGGQYGEKKNLYVLFQSYGAGGLAVSNVGAFFFSYDLQFKDI
jgi:hypothetical protein